MNNYTLFEPRTHMVMDVVNTLMIQTADKLNQIGLECEDIAAVNNVWYFIVQPYSFWEMQIGKEEKTGADALVFDPFDKKKMHFSNVYLDGLAVIENKPVESTYEKEMQLLAEGKNQDE